MARQVLNFEPTTPEKKNGCPGQMSCDVAGVEQDVVDRTVAIGTTNTNESSTPFELWSAPKWPNSICLFSL
jgi:hypothetical protein